MARFEVSNVFEEQVVLLNDINTKVAGDKEASPLLQMMKNKGIVLADDIAAGVTASKSNVDFLAKGILGQEFCKKRDVVMDPIVKHISNSFQLLQLVNQILCAE